MTPEQEQDAFAFCAHYTIIEYGYKFSAWEDVRPTVLLMLVAMQNAWHIGATDENEKKVEEVLERIRKHVYETDVRNIMAYCQQHSQKVRP